MTTKEKGLQVELELEGLDGNAFSLVGAFKHAARRQGKTPAEIDAVVKECLSGDYDHLLQTLQANTVDPEDAVLPDLQ